jgi:anti-sigma regulatory factor (Ser/Thr protein kinase)
MAQRIRGPALNTDQHEDKIVLRRLPSEAERARRQVSSTCYDMARDVVATAQLLTSELFSNALDHGAGDITLQISRLPGELRVEVSDRSPDQPKVRPVTLSDVRGRGLMILEALALRWGVRSNGAEQGKTVWFTLRTSE